MSISGCGVDSNAGEMEKVAQNRKYYQDNGLSSGSCVFTKSKSEKKAASTSKAKITTLSNEKAVAKESGFDVMKETIVSVVRNGQQKKAKNKSESKVNYPSLTSLSGWRSEEWENTDICKITNNSDKSISITVQKGGRAKAALSVKVPGDFKRYRSLRLEVKKHSAKAVSVAVFVKGKGGEEYFESESLPVLKSEKVITFGFDTKNWKSASSSWKHSTAVRDGFIPEYVGLIFYGCKGKDKVSVKSLSFVPGDKSKSKSK
jgi:predicted transcriptional regulator